MTTTPARRFSGALNASTMAMVRVAVMACALAIISLPGVSYAQAFRFESVRNTGDMHEFIRQHFPVGSQRDQVRRTFVEQGGATLKLHPTRTGTEKYIYDINLCNIYIWRWNISADYDQSGKVVQMYVNGEYVLPEGPPQKFADHSHSTSKQKATIYRGVRARPQAINGESQMYFVLIDWDSDLTTIDDQELSGGGPTQADPTNMGVLHVYHVEPWRSIFDTDDAKFIAPYSGDCRKVQTPPGASRPNVSLMVVNTLMHAMNSVKPPASSPDAARSR